MVTTIATAMAMVMPVAKAKAKILATGRKGYAIYFGKTNFRQYSKIRASNYGYGRGWAKLAKLSSSELNLDKLWGWPAKWGNKSFLLKVCLTLGG